MRKSVLTTLVGLATLGVAAPAHAAFPGAPGRIAFVTDVSPAVEPGSIHEYTGDEIWTANPDNTGFRRLTTNDPSISDTDPAWSPSGRRIAFASNRSGTYQVYTMRPDGSDVRALTRGSQPARSPAWSPGGLLVVFARGGDLWITTIAGFPTWRLTRTPDVDEWSPSWSPLGLRIAYTVITGTRLAEIWTVRPDGRDARSLTAVTATGEALETDPDYTPDGRRILFASRRQVPFEGYGHGVWSMRTDGTDPVRLVEGEYHAGVGGVSVSPDGSRFVADACGFGICFLPIYALPSDGSPAPIVGRVFDFTGDVRLLSPTWQPLR